MMLWDSGQGRIFSWKMQHVAFFTSFVFREVGHFQAFPLISRIIAANKSKSFCREYVPVFFFFFKSPLCDFVCITKPNCSYRSSGFWGNISNGGNYITPSTLHAVLLHHVLYSLSPLFHDLVEHIAVLQDADLGERCARSLSYSMCKANTSGVMTFISFLFYSPLLLIITHSNMQMRSSDLITNPFCTCANTDPRENVDFFFLQS